MARSSCTWATTDNRLPCVPIPLRSLHYRRPSRRMLARLRQGRTPANRRQRQNRRAAARACRHRRRRDRHARSARARARSARRLAGDRGPAGRERQPAAARGRRSSEERPATGDVAEPTADDAVSVIREYYAAINAAISPRIHIVVRRWQRQRSVAAAVRRWLRRNHRRVGGDACRLATSMPRPDRAIVEVPVSDHRHPARRQPAQVRRAPTRCAAPWSMAQRRNSGHGGSDRRIFAKCSDAATPHAAHSGHGMPVPGRG